MADPNNQPALVIQCPNAECGTSDLDNIMLCEFMPSMWKIEVEGRRLIADTGTQDSGEYDEATRHLYCTLCYTEWKVPTIAEVDWK